MKKRWPYCTAILLITGWPNALQAQKKGEYRNQLRVSVDEDFINIRGQGTDKAYTAGTFIDYFYNKKNSTFFLERWAPKAGNNAINIYGVGLIHLVFTPNNTKAEAPIHNDYPYAGAHGWHAGRSIGRQGDTGIRAQAYRYTTTDGMGKSIAQ